MRRGNSSAVSLTAEVMTFPIPGWYIIYGLVCLLCVNSVQGQINVIVRHNGSNVTSANYSDDTLFSKRYSYISESGIEGHLFLPTPANACSYIDPPPGGFPVNVTWIALVYDYPSCPSDMVMNVRNAGYKLIIASSRNDSHRTVSKEVSDTLLPIAIITEEYADYLRENATSDSPDDPILVVVYGSIAVSIVIMTVSAFLCQLCCCSCCLITCLCCCCYWDEDCECPCFEQQRHYEPMTIHERIGRRELTESIQRQIHVLQLDMRMQIPLGRQLARRLPTRKYKAESETTDNCVICVDDFAEGDTVRVLPCDHIFHPQCIDEWLVNHSSLCPLCKRRVPRVAVPPLERSQGRNLTEETDDSVELLPRQGRRSNQMVEYGSV